MIAPLRVLHCWSGNLYGGVETLLATLARQPHPGLVSEFALCFEGRLADELRAAGAAVHRLAPARFSRPWTAWKARGALRRVLDETPFDVVACHGCWSHLLCAPVVARRGGRPVFWLHDVASGTHWLERLASRTPPALALAGSRFASETIPRLFLEAPRAVLYPPAPPPLVDRAEARASIRAELATPGDATVLVMTSRIAPMKGHRLLADALGRLRDRPGWLAWIAGGVQRPEEVAYLDDVRSRLDAAGVGDRVRFLGHRSDVARLLAAADIYCQPNLGAETFGLAFVEAMDAGLPVVTTRLGAAVEVVAESCGLLVPPGDPPALAEALARLLDDPEARRLLGAAGPARARALCDPGAALRRLEGLLRDACLPARAAEGPTTIPPRPDPVLPR